MENKKKFRILKSETILSSFIEEGTSFYVGLLFEDFIKSPNLEKYNIPKEHDTLLGGIVPTPIGSATKSNVKGKFVRKQPEEKIIERRKIKYKKKDGSKVEYTRDFNIYIKELLHQYNIEISFKENLHKQKLVVSPLLTFDNSIDNNRKNTHVINMFCELCNDFEILTDSLDLAIKFNRRFESELLPKGKLSEGRNFDEVIESVNQTIKNAKETEAFMKRLQVLKEFNPDILGKGKSGFQGYILFGFTDKKTIILESMYSGNATYIIDSDGYEEIIVKDKQDILGNRLMKKRFFHLDNWETKIRAYLESLTKNTINEGISE